MISQTITTIAIIILLLEWCNLSCSTLVDSKLHPFSMASASLE